MNNFIKLNSPNLKRWDVRDFQDVPGILKERESFLIQFRISQFQDLGF